jgi:transcriptional regulator with XRE-family HTH domain
MSQETLAKLSGYGDRSTISRVEKGEIDLPHSKLVSISDALRCDPMYLLFGDKNEVVIEKVRKLDEYDIDRLSAYLDGLLDAEKYSKKGESDTA